MPRLFLLLPLLALNLLASCGPQDDSLPEGKTSAFVSIPPQAFFVNRIGGDHVRTGILVPAGQSPHTFEPTPQQIARLEQADVYFRIGIPFEDQLIDRIGQLLPSSRIIDTREGIPLRTIEGHHHEDHDEPGHHGEAPDPHVWLDPILVKTQARTIAEALIGLDPDRRALYESRLAEFQHELDSVDALIAQLLAPYAGRTIYVFHPSYGYFTDRYRLHQSAIETDGKEPAARELARLMHEAHGDSVTAIFIQRQFAQKTARVIADQIGAELITLDPLSEDYLANLVAMAGAIASGLGGEEVAP